MRSFYIILLCLCVIAGCHKRFQATPVNTAEIHFNFKNVVGNDSLITGNNYITTLGETINVTTFKYYITNISLQDSATSKWLRLPNSYFLVDEDDAASKIFSIKANSGNYKAVSFLIGVDSLHNVSGVQTGALDPSKGMFWTWNSGYIQAKLEGYSPAAKGINNKFTYHIGGFKSNDNTVRHVVLALPNVVHLNQNNKATIIINADVNKWFDGPHKLKISDSSYTMTPGKFAMQFADNYAKMFTISNVINE